MERSPRTDLGILRRWWRALNRDIPRFLHYPDGTTYFTNDEDRIAEYKRIWDEHRRDNP